MPLLLRASRAAFILAPVVIAATISVGAHVTFRRVAERHRTPPDFVSALEATVAAHLELADIRSVHAERAGRPAAEVAMAIAPHQAEFGRVLDRLAVQTPSAMPEQQERLRAMRDLTRRVDVFVPVGLTRLLAEYDREVLTDVRRWEVETRGNATAFARYFALLVIATSVVGAFVGLLVHTVIARALAQQQAARRAAEEANAALRVSEDLLHVALTGSKTAVFTQDRDLRFTWVHNPLPAWKDVPIVGRLEEEVLGRENAAPSLALKRRVLASGLMERASITLVRHGVEHTLDLTVHPQRDAAGRVVGVVCATVDITEERAAARRAMALEQVVAHLTQALTPQDAARVAAEELPPAVGAIGALLTFVTPDGEGLAIVHDAVAPGGTVAWPRMLPLTAPFPMTDAARLEEPVWCQSRAELDARYPVLAGHAIGPGESWGAIPLLAHDRLLGAIGIVYREQDAFSPAVRLVLLDAARRVARTIERAQLYQAAQAGSEAKSHFLATMSHELRTPLNAVIGYTDLLDLGLDGPVTEAMHRKFMAIKRAATHLQSLIEEILEFSRLEAGHAVVHPEPIDVQTVLEELEAVLAPLAAQKAIAFRVERDGEWPEGAMVITDKGKLRQIGINLLGNAIKFTDRGSVTFTVAHAPDALTFTCRDTGIGIAPDVAHRIFDPFWQASRGFARTAEGTGLGLAIAKRLAELLGGTLTFESTLGEGSTFRLTLPWATPMGPHGPESGSH